MAKSVKQNINKPQQGVDALPKLMKRKLFKKSCSKILPNNKQQSHCYVMVALEKYNPEQYYRSIYNCT